jgi:hypothetical protein
VAVLKESVWQSCKTLGAKVVGAKSLGAKSFGASRFAALMLCVLSLSLPSNVQGQPVPAGDPPAAAPSAPAPKPVATASGYYIEFRAGSIGTYGHSYVVYGANGGKPNYADLHPMGGYAGMAAGHVVPVPANAVWNPDVLKLPISSRYRVALTGDQYRKLLVAVKQVKASSPVWNAVLNNCNHFIGQLAMAVGLKVPTSFQIATSFVPALKQLNEEAKAPAQKRRAAPPPA